MVKSARIKHRFHFISLLYLITLSVKASGLSACQGQPQTISISRGQKISVVYWVGDNQSSDEDELPTTTVFTTTLASENDLESKNEQELAATTEALIETTEGSQLILEERGAVTNQLEETTQGIEELEESIVTTASPSLVSESFDGRNEVESNETTIVEFKNDVPQDQNNSSYTGKSDESIEENVTGRNYEETTIIPDVENTTQLQGKDGGNATEVIEREELTTASADVDNSTVIEGRNHAVSHFNDSEISEGRQDDATVSAKNSIVEEEASTIAAQSYEADLELTTQQLPEARLIEENLASTENIAPQDRSRSNEEQVTEVEYWNTTPGVLDDRSATENLNLEEVKVEIAEPKVNYDENNLNDSFTGKSQELDYTSEKSIENRALEQSTQLAEAELNGKQLVDSSTVADLEPAEQNTENVLSETTNADALVQKSLFESLTSTVKSILSGTFVSNNELTTFAEPEDDESLITTEPSNNFIYEETSKDHEIVRTNEQETQSDEETPPSITIIQVGDKLVPKNSEEEEPLESSSNSPFNDIGNIPSTTIVSVFDTRINGGTKEEARKVEDSNIEFIPLEIITNNQQQQQEPALYNDRSDSANDYFVPTNFYLPNANQFRIPQSRVHYVSMLRPPDGILPMQSLNFDSGFKSKRRRILHRGARTKRDINGTNCEWVFKSEPGVPLLLTFKSFSTPETDVCKDHYISVERESNGFISRWCGVSGEKPGHAAFARSEIRLQLHSKGDGSFPTGFSVEVQALDLKLLRKYAEVRRIVKGH